MAVSTRRSGRAWLLAGTAAGVVVVALLGGGLALSSQPSPSPGPSPSVQATDAGGPSEQPVTGSPAPTPGTGAISPTPRPNAVIPSAIDPTGGVDTTAALQGFIDRVPDGALITFPTAARFRVDGTLVLDGRHDLTFDGNGATLFVGTRSDDPESAMWRLLGSAGITFRGLVIQGGHPDPGTYVEGFEWQHSFDIQGGSGVEIADTTMEQNQGDCVYIADRGDWASDIWVHDSVCRDNGRMGVAVVAGRRVLVERVDFSGIASIVLDLEPNLPTNPRIQGASEVVFRDNRIHDTESQFFSAGGHGPIGDVSIIDNDASGARFGIWSSVKPLDDNRRPDIVFRGNRASLPWHGPDGAALTFDLVDRLVVSDNVQPLLPFTGMAFAKVSRSCDVQISQNTAPGAAAQVRSDSFQCG